MRTSLFMLLFAFLSINVVAQTDVADKVVSHIKTGNAKELSKHFPANIDLVVEELDDVYSKTQAELILKKFFDENPPESFEIIHSGKSSLGTEYRIGNLKTKNGIFRVTFYMKEEGDIFVVHQLQIEEG